MKAKCNTTIAKAKCVTTILCKNRYEPYAMTFVKHMIVMSNTIPHNHPSPASLQSGWMMDCLTRH